MPRWESELITTTLSGRCYERDKYRIYLYGSTVGYESLKPRAKVLHQNPETSYVKEEFSGI